jgi:hypothetical protein
LGKKNVKPKKGEKNTKKKKDKKNEQTKKKQKGRSMWRGKATVISTRLLNNMCVCVCVGSRPGS